MDDQDSSAEEFRVFIRDLGVRAFDQLASGLGAASDAVSRGAQSMSNLAGTWNKMPASEKEKFFNELIAAAQNVAAAAPSFIGLGRTSRKKSEASNDKSSGEAPRQKQPKKKTTTRKAKKK